jgi:protein-disulfide isomerase
MSEEGAITIKKKDLWKYSTFVLIAVIVVIGFFSLTGNDSAAGEAIAPTQPTAPTGSVKVQIEDNDPVLGNPDAEISIVEFSDFQCPFCARANSGAIADFKNSDYFKNGDVNLVFKQFPLTSIHPFAQNAAEASLCAQDQGKFWEYHDILFSNQGSLDDASLKAYAAQLGLDTEAFNSCLDSDEKKSEVLKESAQAQAAGGRGTPYFVIINNDNGNTQTVSGAVPWANFEAAISSL